MSIITISRGSYSRGKEVAEKVAAKLGYDCLSRDIVLETAIKYHVPEIKLIRALHDAPSILDRLMGGKEKYIADFRAVLLEHLKKDNVVYHGLAGQFFLKGIPHVLKVRILGNFEKRIQEEMKREGISEKAARQILEDDDEERRQWSIHLYGVDTWDPGLYDMVIKIDVISVDCAAEFIANAASRPIFKKTEASQKKLDDLSLAATVEAEIAENAVDSVRADNGDITVILKPGVKKKPALVEKISSSAAGIDGVKTIQVEAATSKISF
ncbi:MAG: cytidylate kinase-like family protein [bacterium]